MNKPEPTNLRVNKEATTMAAPAVERPTDLAAENAARIEKAKQLGWVFKNEKDYIVFEHPEHGIMCYFPNCTPEDTRDRLDIAGIPPFASNVEQETPASLLVRSYQEGWHDLAVMLGVKCWPIQEPRFITEAVQNLLSEKEPSDGNTLNLQMALEAEVRKVIAALKDSNDLGLTLGDGVVSWPLGAEILYRLEKCLSSHAPESSSGDTRRLDWLERHPEKLSHCSWVNTARGRIFSMGHDLDPTVGDCHKTLREAIDKALQDARAASDGVERDSPRQLPKSSPSSPLQETGREEKGL